MSIKDQVDDALFLASNGRRLGALTLLLLAVGASSRKVLNIWTKGSGIAKSQGLKSRRPGKLNEAMGDGEAFQLFLGGRLRRIMHAALLSPGPDVLDERCGISVNFNGEQADLVSILYEEYRCNLAHQAVLGAKVDFDSAGGYDLQLIGGQAVRLGAGWIDRLVEVVRLARCNAAEFGLSHHDFVTVSGLPEVEVLASLGDKHKASMGRMEMLLHVVRSIARDALPTAGAEALATAYKNAATARAIHSGALKKCGFEDGEGNLLDPGADALAELAASFKWTPAQ